MGDQEDSSISRPFTLRHALVFVAATSIGMALTRPLGSVAYADWRSSVNIERTPGGIQDGRNAANGAYYTSMYGQDLSGRWFGYLTYWSQRVAFWPVPTLIVLTSAVAVLATRSRALGPGVIGCVTGLFAIAALGLALPQSLISASSGPIEALHGVQWWATLCFLAPWSAGLTVSVSWLALAIGGAWRAHRDRLDRLGLFLGGCWIFLGLTRVVSSWMSVFLP